MTDQQSFNQVGQQQEPKHPRKIDKWPFIIGASVIAGGIALGSIIGGTIVATRDDDNSVQEASPTTSQSYDEPVIITAPTTTRPIICPPGQHHPLFSTECVPDGPPPVSLADFNAVQTGMSLDQVREIFHGQDGVLQSQSDVSAGSFSIHTESWQWDGTGNFSNVFIILQNGKVEVKSQYGLV